MTYLIKYIHGIFIIETRRSIIIDLFILYIYIANIKYTGDYKILQIVKEIYGI